MDNYPIPQATKEKMDYQPKTERRKKSDKAKEKYEKNGKYNQKAVRMMKEARAKEPSTKGSK